MASNVNMRKADRISMADTPRQPMVSTAMQHCTCAVVLAATLGLLGCAGGSAPTTRLEQQPDDPAKTWQEADVSLPAAPQDANLLPFDVSAAATQRFAIDAKSLTLGADGVVRYTLVTRSISGASNVSYEGIRCTTREWKIYAIGRTDGSWSPARRSQWQPVINDAINRRQAALSKQYLCAETTVAGKPEDMLRRLRRQDTLTEELLR